MKWFKNYVGKFIYLWKHVHSDCRGALIEEFFFYPTNLEGRYDEEVHFQENLKKAFKR